MKCFILVLIIYIIYLAFKSYPYALKVFTEGKETNFIKFIMLIGYIALTVSF